MDEAGVEPFAYFRDVLERTAIASPKSLTPRSWKNAREQAGVSE